MDYPQDMTPVQRAAKLLQLLEGGARLTVPAAAERLGVKRQSIYRIVRNIGIVCPDIRIEDGEVVREEL